VQFFYSILLVSTNSHDLSLRFGRFCACDFFCAKNHQQKPSLRDLWGMGEKLAENLRDGDEKWKNRGEKNEPIN
jgi:hypothetical protein